MSIFPHAEKLKSAHEAVICDSGLSRQAHRELFRLNEDAYITLSETDNVIEVISNVLHFYNSSPEAALSKIHFSLTWRNILQVSLWQSARPTTGDLFTILRNAGITSEEMLPFRNSDADDIFPNLYYGKRFDILRRICHIAKRQVEMRFNHRSVRAVIHLVAEDSKRIAASSL